MGESCPLRGARLRDEAREEAVGALGLGARTDPLREVRSGVLGGPGIRLDARDPRARPAELGDRGGEQSDAPVEVEVRGGRVDAARRIERRPDGRAEGGCREAMHLPEPAGVHGEAPRADPLGDDLASRRVLGCAWGGGACAAAAAATGAAAIGARRGARGAGRGGRTMTRTPPSDGSTRSTSRPEPFEAARDLGDRLGRERQVGGFDDAVAARGERADAAFVVDVQTHARAPVQAVRVLRGIRASPGPRPQSPPERSSCRGGDAREAAQRVVQHLLLQGALVREVDVTEVGPARALLGRHGDIRGGPHMRAPMRRGVQDVDDVGAPEGGLRGVGEHGAHPLARDRTLHEHDPPVVPRDEDAAVCDIGDLEVELIAILHPPMLPHPRAPTGLVRWRHARVPGLHLPARLMLLRQAGSSR
jgi:hypothetical protein